VRITFRETLPGYRVRLRRDYIELLISAPEEKPAKAPTAPAKDAKEAKEAPKPASKPAPAKSVAKPAAKH
jgi:hypothetical protein